MILNIILVISGLISSFLLFNKFPVLKKMEKESELYNISIIIPARNEAEMLPFLLESLNNQTYAVNEVICIDDCSSDNTAEIARAYNAKVISIEEKPSDWMGKSWACQKGADASKGEILLFLDADVRLGKDAVACIIEELSQTNAVISVLPYHKTKKSYEKLSFFFNIIQAGANGVTAFKDLGNAGLFGPVILIKKADYNYIGGHESVKNSIVDDVALGGRLKENGKKFKLLLGGKKIQYHMYPSGFVSLFRGWLKNYSTGALKTPFALFVLVFLWIASCIQTVLTLVQSIYINDVFSIILFTGFYILWMAEIARISFKLGNFTFWQILFYPIFLLFFVLVFMLSLFKKLLRQNVVWKDRKIKLEK